MDWMGSLGQGVGVDKASEDRVLGTTNICSMGVCEKGLAGVTEKELSVRQFLEGSPVVTFYILYFKEILH